MTLSEFYKERMAANPGLTRRELVDAVGSATVYAIQHDVPRNFRKSTLHKLAELWKCSVGDIQACLAELPNPLREEAEKPEGNAGISITAKAGKSKKKATPAPDPEEPAVVFRVDEPEEEAEERAFPVYHSVYEEDRQEGEERYKQKLRDMCLRIFASGIPGVHTMEKIYADIGYAIVKELAQGGDNE